MFLIDVSDVSTAGIPAVFETEQVIVSVPSFNKVSAPDAIVTVFELINPVTGP